MIAWPVVIRFYHDDELLFVSDENEWEQDPARLVHSYGENDTVIDCEGRVYALSSDGSDKFAHIRDTGEKMLLDEFADVIKRHVSALGECCAAKLDIDSFHQGILMVGQTDQRSET